MDDLRFGYEEPTDMIVEEEVVEPAFGTEQTGQPAQTEQTALTNTVEEKEGFKMFEVEDPSSDSFFRRLRLTRDAALAKTGNAAEANLAMYNMYDQQKDRYHRAQQYDLAKKEGYTDESFAVWVETADPSKLAKQKAAKLETEVVDNGDGTRYLINSQTGDILREYGTKETNDRKTDFIEIDDYKVLVDTQTGQELKRWDLTRTQAGKGGRGGSGSTSVYVQKAIDQASQEAVKYESSANSATVLADKIAAIPDDKWKTGLYGMGHTWMSDILGNQDDIDMMKKDYKAMFNKEVIASLPPGVATDSDVKIFSSGFPDGNWPKNKVESWLRGQAKASMSMYNYQVFRSDYASTHNGFLASNGKPFFQHWRESDHYQANMKAREEDKVKPTSEPKAVDNDPLGIR